MTLVDGLTEIDGWLDANPDELVMLRIEAHLDGATGHDAAAAALTNTIGDHLVTPPPATDGCAKLDLDWTRADIRERGQVMLISDCGHGDNWPAMVFNDSAVRVESTVRAQDFSYPACAGIARTGDNSHESRWIRFYDDATLLSSYASFGGTPPRRATPSIAEGWTRCGVNQPAFDHLTPTDGRLAALVWTWATDGNQEGDCAVVDTATGRLAARPCHSDPLPHLCASGHGEVWITASPSGPADDEACDGGHPAVPRSGWEAQRVVDLGAAAPEAWVALTRGPNGWGG